MLTIQRATASDVDAMHGIQMRAFEEEGRRCGTQALPPLQETRASIAAHVESEIALVARDGRTVVGCVRGLRRGAVCTVRALVVEPSRHGQGIGAALLRALEAGLVGVERIELTTNTVMERNVAFYERHGYRVHGRTALMAGIELAHLSKTMPAATPGRRPD